MKSEPERQRHIGRWPSRSLQYTVHCSLCTLLAGCGVTPLTNKVAPGRDAFVIGVGEAADGMTDFYAASASGGPVFRLTFNRLQEQKPRLSQSGTMLAYLRSSPVETTDPEPEIVVLNLVSMAERGVRLPPGAGAATAVAWLPGDSALVVRAGEGLWTSPAPPARLALTRLPQAEALRADSALQVVLGEPAAAMVVPCEGGSAGVCVRADSGPPDRLEAEATGPVRWGADSVGYWTRLGFTVRPLAGGRPRLPRWRDAPGRFRELTQHPGRSTVEGPAPNPPTRVP